MMNKRVSFWLVGFSALVVIGVWIGMHFGPSTQQVTMPDRKEPIITSMPLGSKAPIMASGQGGKVDAIVVAKELAQKMELFREAFSTQIDFYGKVVDEKGGPVANAGTHYILDTGSEKGSPTMSGPVSDSEGRFSILGKAGAGILVSVSHPDYYAVDRVMRDVTYSSLLPRSGVSIPTTNSPAIFVLRKKGPRVALVHKYIKTRLPLDGSLKSFAVIPDTPTAKGGIVTLSLKSDGNKMPVNEYNPFDWTLRIQLPGGGIEERKDRFQFAAPDSGYEPEIVISEPASQDKSKWSGNINREFFVRFPSGLHGRIRIQLGAELGYCNIESFVNPDPSSVNLESDPSQK